MWEVQQTVKQYYMQFRRWRPLMGDNDYGTEMDTFRTYKGKVPKHILQQEQLAFSARHDGVEAMCQPMAAAPFLPLEITPWEDISDIDFEKAKTTIVVPSADGENSWGREVRIISLPELFVHCIQQGCRWTAEDMLAHWMKGLVIVAAVDQSTATPPQPRRGQEEAWQTQPQPAAQPRPAAQKTPPPPPPPPPSSQKAEESQHTAVRADNESDGDRGGCSGLVLSERKDVEPEDAEEAEKSADGDRNGDSRHNHKRSRSKSAGSERRSSGSSASDSRGGSPRRYRGYRGR